MSTTTNSKILLTDIKFHTLSKRSSGRDESGAVVERYVDLVRFSTACFSISPDDCTDLFVEVGDENLTVSETLSLARQKLSKLLKSLASELEDDNWNGRD